MAAATLPVCKITHSSPASANRTGKHKQCVLLIEDDKDAMRWVQHSLKKYGDGKFKLEWGQCLSDGLSRLSKGGIDLILLDLGLPDCSSQFTAGWVHKAAPNVPVVVLTGDQSELAEVSAFAGGIEKYLVKGQVSCSELVKAISEALRTDGLPEESPT